MQYAIAILRGVIVSYFAYSVFLFWYRWFVARDVRKLQSQRTQTVTITPVVPSFHTGGLVPSSSLLAAVSAGQIMSQTFAASLAEPTEPLVETWSNEKVEAWRVVDVKEGDDGMWLGFPHPDGPTGPMPVRHPVGVELHAICRAAAQATTTPGTPCDDVPGETCQSSFGDGCGFYAFKTREQAVERARNFSFALHSQSVARVLLSGKVIEHEDGYRAEILEVIDIEEPTTQTLASPFGQAAAAISAFAAARMGNIGSSPTKNPFINLGGV